MSILEINGGKVRVIDNQDDDNGDLQDKIDLLFTMAKLLNYEMRGLEINLVRCPSFFVTLWSREKIFELVFHIDENILVLVEFNYLFERRVYRGKHENFSLATDEMNQLLQKIDELISYL